jgi:hypothetical protein
LMCHLKHSCCAPSQAVFYSEFYGVYPTCWHQWKGGQPTCPPGAIVPADTLPPEKLPAAEEEISPKSLEAPREKLPLPMPEVPPK